jgi:hypothetical protein
VLCSVAPLSPGVTLEGYRDLPPGIHSLRWEEAPTASPQSTHSMLPYSHSGDGIDSGSQEAAGMAAVYLQHAWTDPRLASLSSFERLPPTLPLDERRKCFEETVAAVLEVLRQAVAVRCQRIEDACSSSSSRPAAGQEQPQQGPAWQRNGVDPSLDPARILILFSGGVDSTLLAALAHEALPPDVPIDLSSVCFAQGASPDRAAALDALEELRRFAPTRQWRLIQVANRSPLCMAMHCLHWLRECYVGRGSGGRGQVVGCRGRVKSDGSDYSEQ